MTALCLDTNTYSDFARGSAIAIEMLEAADHIWMPAVVLGELRAGFLKGSRGAANEFALAQFLAETNVTVVPISATTSHHYAGVVEQLRSQGTPIPTNDIWIAACALEQGCPLFSYDRHFAQVTGLTVFATPAQWLHHLTQKPPQ